MFEDLTIHLGNKYNMRATANGTGSTGSEKQGSGARVELVESTAWGK